MFDIAFISNAAKDFASKLKEPNVLSDGEPTLCLIRNTQQELFGALSTHLICKGEVLRLDSVLCAAAELAKGECCTAQELIVINLRSGTIAAPDKESLAALLQLDPTNSACMAVVSEGCAKSIDALLSAPAEAEEPAPKAADFFAGFGADDEETAFTPVGFDSAALTAEIMRAVNEKKEEPIEQETLAPPSVEENPAAAEEPPAMLGAAEDCVEAVIIDENNPFYDAPVILSESSNVQDETERTTPRETRPIRIFSDAHRNDDTYIDPLPKLSLREQKKQNRINEKLDAKKRKEMVKQAKKQKKFAKLNASYHNSGDADF